MAPIRKRPHPPAGAGFGVQAQDQGGPPGSLSKTWHLRCQFLIPIGSRFLTVAQVHVVLWRFFA